MRRWIAMGLGLWLALAAGAARAQDWTVSREGDGSAWASQCLPSDEFEQVFTSLCVSVGCRAGEAPSLGLGIQQVTLPPEARVGLSVDGRRLSDLVLSLRPGSFGREAPLQGQEALLDALRTGRMAHIVVETSRGWRGYDLPLSGAGAAIDGALAACPPVGPSGGDDLPGRRSANPAADALAVARPDCEAAGGHFAIEPGFVANADVDGDGANDLLLDYGALRCDGLPRFCGTGGCSQEIWLADPFGTYGRLISDLVDIELPAPGQVRLILDGGACGLSGAEVCEETHAVRDGRLVPKG